MTFPRERLMDAATMDVEVLEQKGKVYGDSWKKRGGIGAFMMVARKWDRIEEQVRHHGYDIFNAIQADSKEEEGTIHQIDDAIRYLMLIRAEAVEQCLILTKAIVEDHEHRGSVHKEHTRGAD